MPTALSVSDLRLTTTPAEASTSAIAKAPPVTIPIKPATPTATLDATQIMLHGKVYDAAHGLDQRLTDATLEWQFTALDWQSHNGRISAPDGIYQLSLMVRPEDELIITASAPGYLPSTAQVQASQLGEFGARLNFGLIHADAPWPTVPGSLGAVTLSGIVYNLAHGLTAPIEHAAITIVKSSVVGPGIHLDLLSNASGTFSTTLELHETDQVQLTIAASNFVTVTLTKNARALAQDQRLSIGLRPQ